jgi:hypothetical protein
VLVEALLGRGPGRIVGLQRIDHRPRQRDLVHGVEHAIHRQHDLH